MRFACTLFFGKLPLYYLVLQHIRGFYLDMGKTELDIEVIDRRKSGREKNVEIMMKK